MNINKDSVRSAIEAFLTAQLEKKAGNQLKAIEAAKTAQDFTQVQKLEAEIADVRAKYNRTSWLAECAEKMAEQLKFGTHISKGIHPGSKGDNVVISHLPALDDDLCGSQSLSDLALDANGSAAALPLASLFDWQVAQGIKIRDVIRDYPDVMAAALSDQPEVAQRYLRAFQEALSGQNGAAKTDERNKQLLWPLDETYHCIIPLYPSALTFHVKNTIDDIRWSEEQKLAREKRFRHPEQTQIPYADLVGIAVTKLGGTKPQNVSQLMSRQGGRNYLLSSLPPYFAAAEQSTLPQLKPHQETLFNRALFRYCYPYFLGLSEVIEDTRNNMDIREYRATMAVMLLRRILSVAQSYRAEYPAGWSRRYPHLNEMQVFWLDPNRCSLPDEDMFTVEDRNDEDWRTAVKTQCSAWIMNRLTDLCRQQDVVLTDVERDYIERLFKQEISRLAREHVEVWT